MPRIAFLSASLLLLNACAGLKGTYVESFGNSVLDTVGLGPAVSTYDAASNLVDSAKTFTPEEEYYIGRAVAAQILKKYPLYDNEAVRTYVNKVGLTVAASSELPVTFGGYHFVVLDTPDLNAMAAPGGFIFISRGMLFSLPDEDALASVLAHEVSHVAKHHGVKSIKQENLSSALAALGKLGGSLACGPVLQQATAVFGAAVDDIVDTLVESGYSRELEYEADAGAVSILARSGYNPRQIMAAFDALDKGFAKAGGGWLSTHPSNDSRREHVLVFVENIVVPAHSQGIQKRQMRFKQALSGRG